jgi:hypothetical protein
MACHRKEHEKKVALWSLVGQKCHVCDLWSLFCGILCPTYRLHVVRDVQATLFRNRKWACSFCVRT